jgi:site-specific recombinase XerD
MAIYPERRGSKLTGKWIAEVTQSGERRRKRFDTQRDGERWADFIKLTGAPPPEEVVAPLGPTFGSVAQETLEHHPGWQKDRDPSRGQRLEYVIERLGKDTPVADVRAKDLYELVTSLKRRPGKAGAKMGAGTINRYLAVASAVLTYARRREYIVGIPVMPWQKEDGHRVYWLSAEAEGAVVASLLTSGLPEAALTVRVLTATGLRWSEFEGLDLSMIEGEWIRLSDTKTDTPRDVPIDPSLASELRAMVAGGRVPGYSTFRRALKSALKSAGQSEEISVHCLRHTTATRLVHAGVNLAVVKEFLGHASMETTLKYTHVSATLLADASKILSPRAGQSSQNAPQTAEVIVLKEAAAEAELKRVLKSTPTTSDAATDA